MQILALMALLLSNLIIAGCSGRAGEERRIQPEYDKQTGRLRVLRYDGNGDGNAETVSHMDGPRVVSIEIDQNEDGLVDRWEYYDANQHLAKVGFSRASDGREDAWSYARPDGSIERIDISLARDGKVTRREYYDGDQMSRVEEDDDGDGKFDKWETYEEGRLASVAFDTVHRGTPDRRLIYGPGGSARLEVDPEGDGVFVAQK
jgi:hypothetical protein